MEKLLVNWTLSYGTNQNSIDTFNITNITEWFQNVVIPVVKKNLQTSLNSSDVEQISKFVLWVSLLSAL